MQKHLLKWMLLLFVLCSSSIFAQNRDSGPTKGVLRVKLQQELATQIGIAPMSRNGIVTTGITPLDRATRQVKAIKMERVFPYAAKYEAKARRHGLHLWYKIEFDETMDPREAKLIFSKVPGIEISENIVPMSLIEGNKKFTLISEQEMKATRAGGVPFNDPLLPKQWHYTNDGSMPGSVKGSDINLFEAWKTATGSKDVVVAIIDGGVDYKHVDLAANMWVNEAEMNGKPGVDDDENGYVDDIHGYNFVTNSSDVYPHDHGTHVAGTVAAVNNNGIGVSGVAGGNGQGGIKMISCQVFDPRSSKDTDFAAAIYYAANAGASIAQCSWGWNTPGYKEDAVLAAIDYFTAEGGGDRMQGGLCIFANGNTGLEGDYYPACYEKVVAVAAMTFNKKSATYSSYGTWVDITAPGGQMDDAVEQGVLSTLPNDKFGYNEGTSMATPHVSGIAALVLSKYGNASFPNETLRQQLLTSVNDFYMNNPEVLGKFGSGYIDTNKALQMSGGAAPDPVTDFILSPSQDNIVLEWIIPAAADNNVNNHLIYYSTSPFTAQSDLSKIPLKRVDTKFYNSGDKITYEITGLSPLTTYYLAMKSVDRWGNAAALSPVKSAQTNAGPKLELDKSALNLSVKAGESLVASDKFVISNTAAGFLKWASYARTVSAKPAGVLKPVPGNLTPFNGRMSAQPYESFPVVSADYMAGDFPKAIAYHTILGAYIGESDENATNSMAQWFMVDAETYPDGFNLTDLNVMGSYGKNPVIEIYEGSSGVMKGKLLKRVNYGSWYYNTDLKLDEQLYFAPGESFWVVIHFQKGNKTPLGAGLAKDKLYTKYSFYSSNWGESWTQLSEVLRDGNLATMADEAVWGITSKSKNPDWSSVLVLTPSSGTVKTGEKAEVKVANDGQVLVNGDYQFNLKLTTNESANAEKNIPVKMKVEGSKPVLQTAKVVDFGDLLLGKSKTLTVEVVNSGYGNFKGKNNSYLQKANIVSTSDQFTVPTSHPGFASRSVSSINIVFKPTKVGSHSGNIVLTDKDDIVYKFVVRGIAGEPAKINVTPNTFDLGELEVGGAAKDVKFTIKNEGQYPLEFVFPKYSDEKITDLGTVSHKFGYTYASNLNGSDAFAYDGNPVLVNPMEITKQFTDGNIWSEAIPLGFTFPYYGESYDKIYVTSYGALAVSTGSIHQCQIPTASPSCINGLGLITAYGANQLRMSGNSKVEYAKIDGKFVVKFVNVMALVYDQEYMPISFRMILSSNGDVEFFYDDYTAAALFNEGGGLFVGLNDKPVLDPFTVTDADSKSDIYSSFNTGTAVKFFAPGRSIIQKLSMTNGVINIGDSQEITATLAATEGHYAGELFNDLAILSNDPIKGSSSVRLNATIIGGNLKPVASLESETIDFGAVFKTSTARASVTVKNAGTNVLQVTEVSLAGNKFTFEQQVPFDVKPGNSKDILVTLPTSTEGEVVDEMTIVTADGKTMKATLKGRVIGVPNINIDLEKIIVETPSGVNLDKTLSIKNEGNESLEYSIIPNSFITLSNQIADEKSEVNYLYSASVDDKNVKFAWEDEKAGIHHKLSYYYNNDFVEVALPEGKELTFYGKSYKKIYIYGPGFISFNKNEDLKEFPMPPGTLPTTETLYTNIIVPFWGAHSMDQTSTAGTYYEFKDDRVVVSFMEYGNTMNRGVCFQAIMYYNGNIKYQYKYADGGGDLMNMFGVAGIQNNGGTVGVLIPERCVVMGQAIELYPVKKATLEPGATDKIEMEILADQMAGKYTSEMVMHTNVPTKPIVNIPIELTITGAPDPVYPAMLGGESVVGASGPTGVLELNFEIANKGTAPFDITDIVSELFENNQLWYYGEHEGLTPDEIEIRYGMYQPGTKLTVGREPIKFKVMFVQYDNVGTYNFPITFSVDGLDKPTIDIPFNLTITPAPVMEFDKQELRFSGVTHDFLGEGEIKISNTGEYKLSYQMNLDPTGVGEVNDDENGGDILRANRAAKASTKVYSDEEKEALVQKVVAVEEAAAEINIPDLPGGGGYTNSLHYPSIVSNPKIYLVGALNKFDQFKAATQYVAPAEGFNLSDIYFRGTIGDLKNVAINAEIIRGNDVATGEVIGKGTLEIEKEEPTKMDGDKPVYSGEYRMLTLDKPVFLNPGEKFYVSLTFPIGYEYSISLINKDDEVVDNRYMGFVAGEWADVAAAFENNYGPIGYLLTCIERKPGTPWVKLLSEKVGEIAPGESATVKVSVNALTAPLDRNNKAVLTIKSNDPEQSLINYPIILDKNVGPTITAPTSTIYVKEDKQAVINIGIVDEENDSFTVKVEDELGIATLGESVDGKFPVTLAPKFGQAGEHRFTVTATDAKDNVSSKTVNFSVEHVNRAPIAKPVSDLELKIGEVTPVMYLSSLFEDPDGDALTYQVNLSATGIVNAYIAPESVIFSALKAGDVEVKVTAKDAAGVSTENTIKIKVELATGIDQVELKNAIIIYPNPVVEKANVTCNLDVEGEISYKLYAGNGALLYDQRDTKARGEAHSIDMSGFAAGVYYLELSVDDMTTTVPVMKK